MNQLDISIIVPIFNEQDSINELYDELSSSVPSSLDYEIIFINDGNYNVYNLPFINNKYRHKHKY